MSMGQESFGHESTELLIINRDTFNEDAGINQPDPVQHKHARRSLLDVRNSGWKLTVIIAFFSSLLVLAFNLGFVLWAVQRHHVQNNRGVLHEGDCDRVKQLSVGLHLVINILSTILLGASNYCMQCLSAPTRADIDKSHLHGKWLDIGVPSVRNLSQVPRKRAILWLCLSLSSLPLHLMYNSTIFSTISANAYNVFAGDESSTQKDLVLNDYGWWLRPSISRLHEGIQSGNLSRLDNSACVDAYATTFQKTRGNLILIVDDSNQTDRHYQLIRKQVVFRPTLRSTPSEDPYGWMCRDDVLRDCNAKMPIIRQNITNDHWMVKDHRVKYCLSEDLTHLQRCKLQYSLPLSVVVIVFNAIKAAIMCYVAVSMTEPPILTTGDAIASFLTAPDASTQGQCLMSRSHVELLQRSGTSSYERSTFDKTPQRWRSAVSMTRWGFCVMCYTISIILCVFLLAYGISQMQNSTGVWSAGLQALETDTLITGDHWPTSVVSNTLIANIPQLIYSCLYFAVNALLTTMALAEEWSSYAIRRKGLRVSAHPQNAQRCTYFLSLPYRYIMPLLLMSATLHWLISQSLFLVGIDAYTPDRERDPNADVTTCGYSPSAIVSSVSVGVLMLACLLGLGFRRFRSGMPVAGGCSVAIAAACHPNQGEGGLAGFKEGVECLPLKWGAVYLDDSVGHCTFSSEGVEMPEDGQVYR